MSRKSNSTTWFYFFAQK